jgi:ectoine hydroxylase
MKLTDAQIAEFDREGYLFLPSVFTPAEAALLRDEAKAIFALDRDEVLHEASGAARMAFACQTYNEAHRRLSRHPRLVEPVMQLLGGPVWMYQYKINAKAAFDGEVWPWHQDFGHWHREDEMPEPRAMNIALFLDEVSAVNGPLMFVPGSHRHGTQTARHDSETTSYPLWALDRETVSRLAGEAGIVAPTGPAGSVLMFHSNIVHASAPNISPFDRRIVYVSLSHVDNRIGKLTRKPWIAQRDFTPLQPLPDDCLQEMVDARSAVAAE